MIKELWLLSFQIRLRPKYIPAAQNPRLPRGKSAASQMRRLLRLGPLSALCVKTNMKQSQHSQPSRPPSTVPASQRLWTQIFTSTAALPAPRPRLSTVCHRRPLLGRHLTHNPWQSLSSATLRLRPSLLRTSPPLWSPSLREHRGRLSPPVPVLFLAAIRTRCSGGFSPSRHRCPVERHLLSRAPCKSTARSSRDQPHQARVQQLSLLPVYQISPCYWPKYLHRD